jgi:membrane protein DedA with SNARE-associated domain
MFDLIKDWMTHHASAPYGLPLAAGLMALESMIAPVPSEVVMPPLGMVLHQRSTEHFDKAWFMWAVLATTAGSLAGSLISYYMGYFGGKPVVMKVGKYLLVNEHHLDLTTAWFKKWGSLTVFICRFVPVVRHLISIPAGIARMNLLKFCLYTVVGATIWNIFLMWVGWKLEANMDKLLHYRTPIDAAFAAAIVLTVAAWYWLHWKRPEKMEAKQVENSK